MREIDYVIENAAFVAHRHEKRNRIHRLQTCNFKIKLLNKTKEFKSIFFKHLKSI
jgi:hypothetical protein